jgi:hypothetical protein
VFQTLSSITAVRIQYSQVELFIVIGYKAPLGCKMYIAIMYCSFHRLLVILPVLE